MHNKVDKSFTIFCVLFALCCLTHFSTHLEPAGWDSPAWWLAIAVVGCAGVVLWRPTRGCFLSLASLQVAHVVADAPFNPDHWLLLAMVSLLAIGTTLAIWLKTGRVTDGQLYDLFSPAARWLFLICYGYAAFAKLNTHFLSTDASCAAELAELQMAISPWLAWVSVPAIAGWITAVCECAVALLLIAPRSRRFGIVLGMVFHTILVVSPAIAVFDFTMTVFTMLFLFAPRNAGDEIARRLTSFGKSVPALADIVRHFLAPAAAVIVALVIARSAAGFAMYGDARVGALRWLINMSIAATMITIAVLTLFTPPQRTEAAVSLRPQLRFHWLILAIALFNGFCPYLGLKTQGAFTMFSNLQTEAGNWNHLLVPRWVRVFSGYQDDLVQLAQIDDERLQSKYVDRDCLVPMFEVRRAVARNPELGLTWLQPDGPLTLKPANLHPALAAPAPWWQRKLLIFRPVPADGAPYCGN